MIYTLVECELLQKDAYWEREGRFNKKGEWQWSSELRSGVCLSPAPLGHEGAQTGNVLALQTETSLGTRETIHQATKAWQDCPWRTSSSDSIFTKEPSELSCVFLSKPRVSGQVFLQLHLNKPAFWLTYQNRGRREHYHEPIIQCLIMPGKKNKYNKIARALKLRTGRKS